jgi:hypothetical protein
MRHCGWGVAEFCTQEEILEHCDPWFRLLIFRRNALSRKKHNSLEEEKHNSLMVHQYEV